MPGDRRVDVTQELGGPGQLLAVVVEARDDQGGNLYPYPERVVEADGIENRLQPGAADAPVGRLAEELQIDIGLTSRATTLS